MSSVPEPERGFAVGKVAARLGLLLCILASFALPTYVLQPSRLTAGVAGEITGGAVVYAALPLIWWAFRRFRYDRAGGPIVLWLVLLVALGGLSIRGAAILAQ